MDLDQVESPHYKTQHQQDTKKRIQTKPMAGPKGVLPEQGVAEGLHPMVIDDVKKLATLSPTDRYSAYANIRDYFKADPALSKMAKELMGGYYEADMLRGNYKTDAAKAKYTELEPMNQAFIKQALGQEQGVAEDSHEEQVARLAAYNERMAGENPPIDLGLREVGNWAKVGHYGDPIKTAWYNIAKYGIRNNKFNDSVDKAMLAIGDFPDKYDLSIPELDTLYSAYETVYDQWEQSKSERGVAEDLDANQKRVGQLGPTEKVGKKGAVGKLVGANENFINQADQAVTTEEDEMAKGILDNIKNMFKPKDPTPVTPITADDIAKGYQTQPEFAAQVKKIAIQQGMSPEDLIKQLQQQVGAGAAQNATVPTQAFHEGLLDTLTKGVQTGVQGVKKFGQDAKAAGKEAWDEVGPMLKQDWKNPIQAAMAKEGEMDEGEHTQHAMRGRNPGANEFEHDFEPEDKVGNIHDKISRMLKRLEKPKYEPNMKDTNIGNTTLDETTEPWETDDEAAEREKKESKSKDSKGSDGSDHGGHSRAKHLAKQAIPKDKVKEGQEDLDAILRIIRK